MSLDITFKKKFTIQEVEDKTSIDIEYQNNNWWMRKNGSSVLIKSYSTEDNGKDNIIDGLTCYMGNTLSEIMDELVLVFQTKFITCEEEEMCYYDSSIDVNALYDEVTLRYGYEIVDGVITKIG